MREYFRTRLDRGDYAPRPLRLPDREPYFNRDGWANYAIGESLAFSFRSTVYTKESFDETLRDHWYYELVIPLRGEVSYVCGDQIASPRFPSVILFRPGEKHTGLLRKNCLYERYVFYFCPEAFSDEQSSLLEKLTRMEGFCMQLPTSRQQALLDLLHQLRCECEGECDLLLCRALSVQILALLTRFGQTGEEAESLPSRIVAVRRFLDENFRIVRSVEDVARAFFYSREHLSRLFKRYYNVSVSSYLIRCRLEAGERLLRSGKTVTEAAFDCGFESLSAFTCAFRRQYGTTPSEYGKAYSEEL